MAQSFLLSAQARTLSLRSIFAAGEDAAYATFCRLRWPDTSGEPVCPRCGSLSAYKIASRRRFECADCRKQYSVTSGTMFHSRKLAFTDILAAICIVANASKGLSALQLSRDLDVQAKTAFVLSHKLREALAAETADARLSGEIEIDGMHTGGSVRPANRKEDRIDRRKAPSKSPDRRVVIAVRQRGGRTLTFVGRHEPEGVAIAKLIVEKGSRIIADEASHWDRLPLTYDMLRINHSVAYSMDGVSTNQVESFFARLRRMIDGQHHHVSARHLHAYAAHCAWLEDHRRRDNGSNTYGALALALAQKPSATWKGYWQRYAK
ncbi:MAG: IS1595 family transposase [Bauldia sp.]|nr:IS1595 family transposase [Bauldia sp.]